MDCIDKALQPNDPRRIFMSRIAYRSDLIMQIILSEQNNPTTAILKAYDRDTDQYAFVSALASLFVTNMYRQEKTN